MFQAGLSASESKAAACGLGRLSRCRQLRRATGAPAMVRGVDRRRLRRGRLVVSYEPEGSRGPEEAEDYPRSVPASNPEGWPFCKRGSMLKAGRLTAPLTDVPSRRPMGDRHGR